MVCIYCSENTRVVNSRPQKTLNSTWRRRQCQKCQAIFTSVEKTDYASSLRVRHTEALEPFLEEKLLFSIHESLKHLQRPAETAKELLQTIVSLLLRQAKDACIDRADIIQTTTDVLGRFDAVAGMHYQARYKR